MKKIFLVGTFVVTLGFGIHTAHAQICADGTTNCATTNSATTPSSGTTQTTQNTSASTNQQGTQPTGFVPLAPIPGLTDSNTVNSTSNLATFFNQLYKYLIGLAAVLAVIEIIRGGLMISLERDSVSAHSKGVELIRQAVLGLVLVLSPVLVFSIINPSILNLSLGLQTLNTAPNTGGGSSDTANQILNTPPSSSNWLTPTGSLSSCANNDCTAAENSCNAQNAPTAGYNAQAQIVCVLNGNVNGSEVAPAVGASGKCAGQGEVKEVECITFSSPGG